MCFVAPGLFPVRRNVLRAFRIVDEELVIGLDAFGRDNAHDSRVVIEVELTVFFRTLPVVETYPLWNLGIPCRIDSHSCATDVPDPVDLLD